MKVSILSTGTEITNGQILNRNSAYISEKVKKFGVDVSFHLAAPDNKQKIMDALIFCANQSDIIFVTGGLGPTTDDFTRDIVAEYLQEELIFDEKTWTKISAVLIERGVAPSESQKQQCYFPKGAEILNNSVGTADGFRIESPKLSIVVLPGPPKEIEAIWNDHVEPWFKRKARDIDPSITLSWDTLGLPEPEVNRITWEALKDLKKDFPMEVGFRVHLPYVEAKITYPRSIDYTAKLFADKIEKALEQWTVLRNFENAAQIFSQIIKHQDFAIYDFYTEGNLHKSVSEHLAFNQNWMWKQSSEAMDSSFFVDERDFIALIPIENSDDVQLIFNFNGRSRNTTLKYPERFKKMKERRQKYVAELALIEFVRFYSK